MNNSNFSVPQRQSAKGIILYFLLSARKLFKIGWPAIVAFFIQGSGFSTKKTIFLIAILGLIVLLLFLHALFSYLKFYFYIEDEEFKVSKGYLKKVNLSIPIGRIQTINSKQNIFQQWLDVVSVEFDTAGASNKELKIVALDKPTANALEDLLKINIKSEGDDIIESGVGDDRKLILKLGFADLFKIGLSENHIKSVLIILAFVAGIIDRLNDYFTSAYEQTVEQAQDFLFSSNIIVYAMLIITVLVIGLAYSLLSIFLRFYNLRFFRDGDKFQVQSGLLNKKTVSLPFSKVQVLSWRTNPLRKLLDFVTLNLAQASSAAENSKKAIDIPGCSSSNLEAVNIEIFPSVNQQQWHMHHSHYNYGIRLWLFVGIIPSSIAMVIWWLNWTIFSIAFLWLIISAMISFLAYKKRYFRISKDILETSSGSVGQKFSRMFNFKVQSVNYKQTIFQRRRNLATLNIYTAGGKVLVIPYIDSTLAFELNNFLLYSAESNQRKWM